MEVPCRSRVLAHPLLLTMARISTSYYVPRRRAAKAGRGQLLRRRCAPSVQHGYARAMR